MQVVYLDSAIADLEWWKTYYEIIFPEGRRKARDVFLKTISLLRETPRLGHVSDVPGALEYVIPRTPFSLIYRLRADRIEILRLWDNRQSPLAGR